jgi:serine/threonine protein kinase
LGTEKRENAVFVAPELIKSEWSVRNDIWSVGALMFTMLTGMPPFNGPDYKEIFRQIPSGKYDQ